MIGSFLNCGTEDLYDGLETAAARRVCPSVLWPTARRKLDLINRVGSLKELRMPPGNRLERLKGARTGEYSLRINDQYRITFKWEDDHADEVGIEDYH